MKGKILPIVKNCGIPVAIIGVIYMVLNEILKFIINAQIEGANLMESMDLMKTYSDTHSILFITALLGCGLVIYKGMKKIKK